MDKKVKFLFEKMAKKLSAEDYKNYETDKSNTSAGALAWNYVPVAGPYLSAPKRVREQHPATSFLLGNAGARGARAKNTGKSELEAIVKQHAIFGSVTGAISGSILGAMVGKKPSAILGGAVGGAAYGAATTAGASAVNYGLGHLFGRDIDK